MTIVKTIKKNRPNQITKVKVLTPDFEYDLEYAPDSILDEDDEDLYSTNSVDGIYSTAKYFYYN